MRVRTSISCALRPGVRWASGLPSKAGPAACLRKSARLPRRRGPENRLKSGRSAARREQCERSASSRARSVRGRWLPAPGRPRGIEPGGETARGRACFQHFSLPSALRRMTPRREFLSGVCQRFSFFQGFSPSLARRRPARSERAFTFSSEAKRYWPLRSFTPSSSAMARSASLNSTAGAAPLP